MARKILITNPNAQSGRSWKACEELVRGRSDIQILDITKATVDSVIQQAIGEGVDTILAAGGDGTISSVAHAIITSGHDLRLGILPTGTFNHFAKDLGIPLDLVAALSVIDAGHTAHVDTGRVNDLSFINNSSIGLYPAMVQARQKLERTGISKWFAFIHVVSDTSLHRRSLSIRLGSDPDCPTKKTAGIFIGNNRYKLEGTSFGTRESLDEGTLFVALMRKISIAGAMRLIVKTMMGTMHADSDIDIVGLKRCVITSHHKWLLVAHDGEVSRLQTPLCYSTQPHSLKVIVPRTIQ